VVSIDKPLKIFYISADFQKNVNGSRFFKQQKYKIGENIECLNAYRITPPPPPPCHWAVPLKSVKSYKLTYKNMGDEVMKVWLIPILTPLFSG
jgi:hypothetical protein